MYSYFIKFGAFSTIISCHVYCSYLSFFLLFQICQYIGSKYPLVLSHTSLKFFSFSFYSLFPVFSTLCCNRYFLLIVLMFTDLFFFSVSFMSHPFSEFYISDIVLLVLGLSFDFLCSFNYFMAIHYLLHHCLHISLNS